MTNPSYKEDLIDLRPDERIDAPKVADFLRGKLPGSDQPLTIRQFSGGAANLTYLLDYGTHEYVLRRPPLGPVAVSAHDMHREHRVLSVLHTAFQYAPQSFLYHEEDDVVGAPFLVMERRKGVVVRMKLPEIYAQDANARRKMSEALIDSMAEFHAVDYETLGLADLGKPEGFVSRQIDGWYRRWQDAKTNDVAEMDAVHTWLKENLPPSKTYSLVHNDYKLDNAMLAPSDPGRIVAIFDWDMCTLGDPLSDLGALLAYWSEPTDPRYALEMARMPTGDLGFPSRRELARRYAEKSNRSMEDINFYYALALFRITVIIAQIYIRFVRRQTQDQRFAVFGKVIPSFARMAEGVAAGEMGVRL